MQITDTIADLLTRIRNASSAKHATVDIPASERIKSMKSFAACDSSAPDLVTIKKGLASL